jgi:sortase (surface protein transpeptidase)
MTMAPHHHRSDRTPARRAAAALLALGLLLCAAGLLLAGGRLDQLRQLRPRPASPTTGAPATITIPAIGVQAPIVGVGLQPDGAMEAPEPDQVGWYRLGPRPGNGGPAVLVGHVRYRRPAVFYRLHELRPGDEILVGQRDGSTTRFLVGRLEQHPKTALPVARIFNRTSQPEVRLITCGGDYDRSTGHYRDNVIVYASPTGN